MSAMQTAISVREQSQVGDARRHATRIAELHGFDISGCGRVALVATELATNLARYGKSGELLIRASDGGLRKFVEFTSIDRGPGMADVHRCLTDGYSTGGTSGTGLGAIQRQSATFEIHSSVPAGTVVYCQVAESSAEIASPVACVWGAINLPAPHEVVCGDTWRIELRDNQLAILMVDGLGHGIDAAKVAQEASDIFDRDAFLALPTLFDNIHARLQGTRGGAVAIAQIDLQADQLKFIGVGNIAGSLRLSTGQAGRGLFSHNGIVGAQIYKAQEFQYPCPTGSLLILHSDGLQSRWSMDNYPGLSSKHPGVIAAVLYRDFCRGRDDVTVAVIRIAGRGAKA